VLWIIISITGTCDGILSRFKDSETLENALKLELSSFISQALLIYEARQVTDVILVLLVCSLKLI